MPAPLAEDRHGINLSQGRSGGGDGTGVAVFFIDLQGSPR